MLYLTNVYIICILYIIIIITFIRYNKMLKQNKLMTLILLIIQHDLGYNSNRCKEVMSGKLINNKYNITVYYIT